MILTVDSNAFSALISNHLSIPGDVSIAREFHFNDDRHGAVVPHHELDLVMRLSDGPFVLEAKAWTDVVDKEPVIVFLAKMLDCLASPSTNPPTICTQTQDWPEPGEFLHHHRRFPPAPLAGPCDGIGARREHPRAVVGVLASTVAEIVTMAKNAEIKSWIGTETIDTGNRTEHPRLPVRTTGMFRFDAA
jgi:hypothetical protein